MSAKQKKEKSSKTKTVVVRLEKDEELVLLEAKERIAVEAILGHFIHVMHYYDGERTSRYKGVPFEEIAFTDDPVINNRGMFFINACIGDSRPDAHEAAGVSDIKQLEKFLGYFLALIKEVRDVYSDFPITIFPSTCVERGNYEYYLLNVKYTPSEYRGLFGKLEVSVKVKEFDKSELVETIKMVQYGKIGESIAVKLPCGDVRPYSFDASNEDLGRDSKDFTKETWGRLVLKPFDDRVTRGVLLGDFSVTGMGTGGQFNTFCSVNKGFGSWLKESRKRGVSMTKLIENSIQSILSLVKRKELLDTSSGTNDILGHLQELREYSYSLVEEEVDFSRDGELLVPEEWDLGYCLRREEIAKCLAIWLTSVVRGNETHQDFFECYFENLLTIADNDCFFTHGILKHANSLLPDNMCFLFSREHSLLKDFRDRESIHGMFLFFDSSPEGWGLTKDYPVRMLTVPVEYRLDLI